LCFRIKLYGASKGVFFQNSRRELKSHRFHENNEKMFVGHQYILNFTKDRYDVDFFVIRENGFSRDELRNCALPIKFSCVQFLFGTKQSLQIPSILNRLFLGIYRRGSHKSRNRSAVMHFAIVFMIRIVPQTISL